MGCRDQFSNFNNLVYEDGRWGYTWGWDFTVAAPRRELIEEYLGEEIIEYTLSFNDRTGNWVATPIEGISA